MKDMTIVWGHQGRFGRLDYVTCWYRRTLDYIRANPATQAALVSTNSITQGEQVGILWADLLRHGVRIHFAHRTFQWSNEASGMAAVHCVIIGFGLRDMQRKRLFDYESPNSEPHAIAVSRINPYLVDAADVLLPSRTAPLPGALPMKKGSQPTDGGHLILTETEKKSLIALEPASIRYLRRYVGGDELINGGSRWCLWLKGISPQTLRAMPNVLDRIERVQEARRKSPTSSVRGYAASPALFTQDRQPDKPYLAIPEVSSENRRYIPMAFLTPAVVASNKLQIIVGAGLLHFGVLSSAMHMAWVRCVSGRLESRYSYAPSIYNNFPWPESPTDKQKQKIEAAAQGELDARAQFPEASLADLYAPLTMPPALVKAHQTLDAAVDAAYGRKGFKNDAERVAFLFELYQKYTTLLTAPDKPRKRRAKATH